MSKQTILAIKISNVCGKAESLLSMTVPASPLEERVIGSLVQELREVCFDINAFLADGDPTAPLITEEALRIANQNMEALRVAQEAANGSDERKG